MLSINSLRRTPDVDDEVGVRNVGVFSVAGLETRGPRGIGIGVLGQSCRYERL